MLDFGVSKLMLIGVVALIVIGPEKLPRVARTAGTLLGRAQRYVNDVKAEVAQQMNVADLNEIKRTVEDAAKNAHASIKNAESSINKQMRGLESSVSKSLHDTQKEVENAWNTQEAKKPYTPAPPTTGKLENLSSQKAESIQQRLQELKPKVPSTPLVEAHMPHQVKKHNPTEEAEKQQPNWRAQRAKTPLWYKRRIKAKDTLRSDAARYLEKTGKPKS